jgi:hypothetical protein
MRQVQLVVVMVVTAFKLLLVERQHIMLAVEVVEIPIRLEV